MYYNIGSLALGFAAWILGIIGICSKKKAPVYQLSSFTCCCAAMFLQFQEIKKLMRIDDWIAVDDTINARCLAAGVLITITVLLNLRSIKK